MRTEVKLADTCLARDLTLTDERRMDLVVHGVSSLYLGRPMFCDVTVRSPVDSSGQPKYRSDIDQGAVLQRAKIQKDGDYPEVATSENVQWLVLGHELYGHTLKEAQVLVAKLAKHKARGTNFLARRTAHILWTVKFWDILACTLVRSIADHYIPVDLPGRRSSFVQDFFPYLEDLM